MWRRGCDPAEVHALDARSLGSAQERAHVVRAADVVEHQSQREASGVGRIRLGERAVEGDVARAGDAPRAARGASCFEP